MKISTPNSGTTFLQTSVSLIVIMLLASLMGSAQLLQWNTFGNTGTETTEPSVTNNANIAATNLTIGAGVTPAGNGNRFGGSAWFNTGNTNPSTVAEAIAGNDFIQFIVTPNANFSFTPTSFVFNWDKSGTGPQNVALRSSVDGFAANLGTVVPTGTIGVSNTITITGLTGLTTATTFRVYGYGATATGGTGGFDIGSNVVNVQLNGTTASTGTTPTVTTVTATGITTTGASSGGNVSSDGGVSVTARGVAYGTGANPTIGGTVTSDGTGTGAFVSTLSPLLVNTQYFYRAYATNNVGTSYGAESSFFTLANLPGAPVVNGATASSLDVTIAANSNPASTQFAIQETNSSNFVQADGSLAAGIMWQTAATWGTKTVTGLASSTSFTFQVNARNGANVETGFGATTTSSTIAANAPLLSTSALTAFGPVCLNITTAANTFTITGSDLTNANVIVGPLPGYSFSKDGNVYTADLTYVQGGGALSETVFVIFTPTAVQSYDGNIPVGGGGASNDDVAASGSGINTAPSVTTSTAGNITQSSALLNGEITAYGCTAYSVYGIEYSTTNNFVNGTGTPVTGAVPNITTYGLNVSGLSANTTYYYKAFATNAGGTTYGLQQSFVTPGLDAPVATAATAITSTSFNANWNAVAGADSYRLDVSTSSNFVDVNASTFVGWSFPTSGTVVTPDVANANNTTKTLTTTGGAIGDVAGIATRAATANAWQSGSGTKYWQIDFNATGLYGLTISSRYWKTIAWKKW